MSRFKTINKNDLTTHETLLYKSQSLTYTSSASDNVIGSYLYHSSSYDDSGISYTIKSNKLNKREVTKSVTRDSLYASLKMNFYLSASDYNLTESKYNNPYFTLGNPTLGCFGDPPGGLNNIHYNKFHSASAAGEIKGLLYSIPAKYFGEYIKPGTFKLEETGGLVLKDDSFGNLYQVVENISFLPDLTTHVSSSQNYVGNIFYRTGLAVVNQHTYIGHPSASINNMGQRFTASFNAAKTIYTSEYTLRINPGEFNVSTNPTAYEYSQSVQLSRVHPALTASGEFKPYFNEVLFYNKHDECVMIGRYPQPIQRNHDVPLKLKIRMDW